MTQLRSRVLSLMVPGFEGTTVPDWLARRLDDGLGGVCWFGQNVASLEQARALADALHQARDGVLVLCDEEGGTVTRLEAEQGSSWPGHASLGQLDDAGATEVVAAALGTQARAAGVDVVLAPVVDVNSDPDNPVIGVRSFGATAPLVGRHGAAFVRGLQSSGVAACAKHFPGHGATRTDSHVGLPLVDATAETLRARDLAPFAAAVAAGVRCVMTAHVVFPAFDDQPATMSPRLLGLLREELGFDGVTISDALDMKAIASGVGRGPGAARALASGVDLICIGNPAFPHGYDAEAALDEVVDAVTRAVEDGTVSRHRLEEAAARVADLASWVRQAGTMPDHDDTGQKIGRETARRIVRVRGDVTVGASPLVVRVEGPINVAAGCRRSPLIDEVSRRRTGVEVIEASTPSDVEGLSARAKGRPVVVVVGPRRDAVGDAIVAAAVAECADAVVVYTGLATAADYETRSVHSFGGGRAMAVAVADTLLGRS